MPGSRATPTPPRRKQSPSTPNPLRRDGDFAPPSASGVRTTQLLRSSDTSNYSLDNSRPAVLLCPTTKAMKGTGCGVPVLCRESANCCEAGQRNAAMTPRSRPANALPVVFRCGASSGFRVRPLARSGLWRRPMAVTSPNRLRLRAQRCGANSGGNTMRRHALVHIRWTRAFCFPAPLTADWKTD